ncbi:hypothetical protein FRB91_006524 [Serendipita sp. 411]|nr:hypothetical protein FRB91_006524 [Serendipita sp. 411]
MSTTRRGRKGNEDEDGLTFAGMSERKRLVGIYPRVADQNEREFVSYCETKMAKSAAGSIEIEAEAEAWHYEPGGDTLHLILLRISCYLIGRWR